MTSSMDDWLLGVGWADLLTDGIRGWMNGVGEYGLGEILNGST